MTFRLSDFVPLNDYDVDAILIELSNAPISYAEADGDVILHYSQDDKLILVEILDFRRLLSTEKVKELLTL